jgi:hypothetical protein
VEAVLKEALEAAEKAGAAIFGEAGKQLAREAGEKAARCRSILLISFLDKFFTFVFGENVIR